LPSHAREPIAPPTPAPPAAPEPERAIPAAEPARPPLAQPRQTPAEMSSTYPPAWVAPVLEEETKRPGRPLWTLSVLAIVTVALCGYFAWKFGLREVFAPARPVAEAAPKPAPQPAPSAPASKAEPKSEPTQAPAAAEAATPAEAAPTPAAAPAGGGAFTVQVSSSTSEADARAAAAALASAGFDAYVVRADLGKRGVWYRVRVGRFATRDEARAASARLRGSGRATNAIIQTYDAP
jgi:septal ring-binding cell division protein DamX